MKKQLIVLSALFVGFASQCSYYDRMKAAAQGMYSTAKSKLTAAKETIQAQLPAAQQLVKENLPAVQEFAKTNILPTVQKLAEDQVILGDKLDSLAKSVPGGEQAMNKIRDLYMSTYHPTFKKNANGQWEDTSKATSGVNKSQSTLTPAEKNE